MTRPGESYTAADRLILYEVMGLTITLAVDGGLHVKGSETLRQMARPSILKHRDALVAELRRRASLNDDAEERAAS